MTGITEITGSSGVPFPQSLLFVPANRAEMLAHAWESDASALVLDLEDSVPAGQKAAARDAVSSLRPPDGWARPIFVRLNSYGTPDFDADVLAAAAAPISGVMMPKVERADDVRAVDLVLAAKQRADWPLTLILLIETPGGILHVAELADCGVKRVVAFAFGAEDYRAGIGVDLLDPALADFARTTVVNAAAAAHVPAIDSPLLHLSDDDGLRAATSHARALGFRAKFAIHPSQVSVINNEFTGGVDQLRVWAARAVAAYERAAADGRGSVALDGRMLDEATMRRARDILKT